MAALARRKWSEILTETIRRAGGITYTGFDVRMEHWITESYLQLCLQFHHFELDKIKTSDTLSTSLNELAIPTDCFSVIALRLRDTSGQYLGSLSPYDAASLITDFSPVNVGAPTRYARYGSKLYFNKLADQAYPLDIYYYGVPTLPDFVSVSDSPVTNVDCDEHIIQGAMDLAHGGTGRPDLADSYRQRLDQWLAVQVRSSVLEQQLPQQREGWSTNKTLGSAQG